MAGRAGRLGLDTCGEAFLLCGTGVPEPYLVELATSGGMEEVSSCLGSAMAMRRAALEAIGSGAVTTAEDVRVFMESTLLCSIQGPALAANAVKEALAWLCREALLITWDQDTGEWRSTQLGAASARGFLKPQDVLQLRVCGVSFVFPGIGLIKAMSSSLFCCERWIVSLLNCVGGSGCSSSMPGSIIRSSSLLPVRE